MAYAVEAVRWTPDHLVQSVRWHQFEYVHGELRKAETVVNGMDTVAMTASRGHDLYLCYHGAVGRKIAVVEFADGRKTLRDLPGGDTAQVLDDLPSF